jgi:Chaperone of endosialidase
MPRLLISLAVLFVVTSMPAAAQPLGTFTWQLQPYCNVLTLAVTQSGTTFTLDGVDDLCGAGPASAVGTAFFKTDGTVGMGLHLVTAPGATPVHITVVLNAATLNGAWTDSGGHSGTLLFDPPPAPVGGAPRPAGGGLSGVAVTSVIAGEGLTGGGMGPVDLAIAFAGSGAATTVARSDHTHARGPGGTAVGEGALQARTTGENNTALGHLALATSTSGGRNTAVGSHALERATTGGGNTAVGTEALTDINDGIFNTAVGDSALVNTTGGTLNTAVGADALFNNIGGGAQTALGYKALYSSNGVHNLAIGWSALSFVTGGGGNIGIGSAAGINITTGSSNIVIGHNGEDLGDESRTIRIGRPTIQTRAFMAGIRGVTTAGAAVPVVVDIDGQLGTISSSRRFKQDIADLGDVGLKLHQLRPVQFRYTSASTDAPVALQYGLIAEEVNEVLPELVARSADGAIETVQYHVLPSLLVAEVQRLERDRKALVDRLDTLEALVRSLTKR